MFKTQCELGSGQHYSASSLEAIMQPTCCLFCGEESKSKHFEEYCKLKHGLHAEDHLVSKLKTLGMINQTQGTALTELPACENKYGHGPPGCVNGFDERVHVMGIGCMYVHTLRDLKT